MNLTSGLGAALLGAALTGGGTLAAGTAPAGVIAYVKQTSTAPLSQKAIHVIRPDGTGDRTLLTLPKTVDWPVLAWRPDGGELAFTSSHDGARSPYERDVYAVRADGSGQRRVTNGPGPAALGGYKTASVTVDVHLPANSSGGPWIVYVDGAPDARAVVGSATVRFDKVAVIPGHPQFAVVMNGLHRWVNAGAQLVAGKVNAMGFANVYGDGLREFGAYDLSWKADASALLFRFGECCVETVPARPPDLARGTILTRPDGFAGFLAYAPTTARKTQYLYGDNSVVNGVQLKLGSEGQTGATTVLTLTKLLGLAWLPDGSGFVYTTDGLDEYGLTSVNSNVWEYDFATKASRQITHFDHNWAYRVSVSPDGRQIAFEYGTEDRIDGIWVVNRDGTGPHLLVKDGIGPAWGRAP